MISREAAMRVARLASEVLRDADIAGRMSDGYTRVDPVSIAEARSISVMLQPLDRLLGAFLAEEDKGILLNSERPSGLVHMTCAHELGHYFLGHGTTADEQLDYSDESAETELEADQFAHSLMVPQKLFVAVMKAQGWGAASLLDPRVVYQLSLRMGVSFSAMVWSMQRTKRINRSQANDLLNVPPARIKQSLAPPGTKLSRFQDVWLLRPVDKGFILEPRTDDVLMIDLPAHAGSGYLWSFSDAQGEGYVLHPVLEDKMGSRSAEGEEVWVGSPASARYSLEVPFVDKESFQRRLEELRLLEIQPWRGSDSSRASLDLTSKAEMIREGLTPASRVQWIESQTDQERQ